jgi:hypothetical protein
MPLDTHVHRIATFLGLSDRKSGDWKAARALTDNLARFDAADPSATTSRSAASASSIFARANRRRKTATCVYCATSADSRDLIPEKVAPQNSVHKNPSAWKKTPPIRKSAPRFNVSNQRISAVFRTALSLNPDPPGHASLLVTNVLLALLTAGVILGAFVSFSENAPRSSASTSRSSARTA